jgi:signal transduction histidine kinase
VSTAAPLAGDAETLLQASRCAVQQHVLGGLLHDLNGPMNNIALTLALVAATVARQAAATPDDPLVARLVRHVATLEAEMLRLGSRSQAMASVLHAEGSGPEPIALRDVAGEVRRQLRHHAALHEIALDEAAPGDDATVDADRERLRFALLALVLAACALCAPGARVVLDVRRRGHEALVRIAAQPATLPDAGRAAFDSPLVSPPSEWLHLVAGRVAATAEGGHVAIVSDARDEVVLEVAFPARR